MLAWGGKLSSLVWTSRKESSTPDRWSDSLVRIFRMQDASAPPGAAASRNGLGSFGWQTTTLPPSPCSCKTSPQV